MTDLRKLAALRREATPGPWYSVGAPWIREPGAVYAGAEDPHKGSFVADTLGDGTVPNSLTDAAYIAAVGSLSAEELDALADVVEAATDVVRQQGRFQPDVEDHRLAVVPITTLDILDDALDLLHLQETTR